MQMTKIAKYCDNFTYLVFSLESALAFMTRICNMQWWIKFALDDIPEGQLGIVEYVVVCSGQTMSVSEIIFYYY